MNHVKIRPRHSSFNMKSLVSILVLSLFYIATVLGQDVTQCPPGIIRNQNLRVFRGHCYEFEVSIARYWDEAGLECIHKGGHLVTVKDLETQQFIMQTLSNLGFSKNGIWIGLTDVAQEGNYLWTTGERANFTYWAPGEPSLFRGVEDCVLMNSSKAYHWEDHPCHLWPQHYTYICEYVTHPTVTVSTGQQFSGSPAVTSVSQGILKGDISQCPAILNRNEHLRVFRDHCYEFVTFQERYWDLAQTECLHKGGHLVTVRDIETQQFIVQTLTDLNFNKNGIWIGLTYSAQEGKYLWTTGERSNFTYWAPGEPSLGIEDCVLMNSTKAYQWEKQPCHLWPEYFPFVCEYDMVQ